MRTTTHALTRPLVFVALVLLGLGSTFTAVAPQAHADDDEAELVVNGDFAAGTEGWRTNGPTQRLHVTDGNGDHAAELTTSTQQTVALNDAVNTVLDSGPIGQQYVLTARVRTETPIVNGALRVREVTPTGAQSHQTSFWLPNDQWQQVELHLTTERANSWLDVNVVAWQLRPDQELQVDSVSVRQLSQDSAHPTPAPSPTPTQEPAPVPEEEPSPRPDPLPDPESGPEPTQCVGTPPSGTQFGASVYTVGMTTEQAIDELDEAFGYTPILRVFSGGMPRAWDDDQADSFDGRALVTSFRAHPSEVISGQHDDYLRDWFANAPNDQVVYWSYFHEPEPRIRDGVFTEEQYKQAWSRLADLADEACNPNLFATLILTGWTAQPAAGRDLSTYDAGPEVIDVVAFDPYNGVYEPDRDYYVSPEDKLGPIVEMMETSGHGRPWGIAEIGSRVIPSDDGTGRAQWLTEIGEYVIDNDGLFVTYFQSTRDGDWVLDDTPSRDAWSELIVR